MHFEMSSNKIILGTVLFIILLLGFLFIFEKMSLKKIDSQSTLGEQTIDLSKRSEIQEKPEGSSKPLDTILKKE